MNKSNKAGHVFISYKTEEREIAQKVRATLALALKCEVWWDQNLQVGGKWNLQLDQAIKDAACVVVLWSKASTKSPWVQQEAAVASALGKLAPAIIDKCEIPAPYQSTQVANLRDWEGDEEHSEFRKLAARVSSCLKATQVRQSSVENSDVATATPATPDFSWPGLVMSFGKPMLVTMSIAYLLWASFVYFQAPVGSKIDVLGMSFQKGQLNGAINSDGVMPYRTLTFGRIQKQNEASYEGYRLNIYINEDSYSFPTNDLWGSYGAIPGTARLLVQPAKEFNLTMDAWVKIDGQPVQLATSETVEINESELIKGEKMFFKVQDIEVQYTLY